jgi:hypothetical protein
MSSAAVFIRLLGPFQIVKMGQPVSLRSGGKAEQLLSCLALHPRVGVHRETLLSSTCLENGKVVNFNCADGLIPAVRRCRDHSQGQCGVTVGT